MKVSLTLKKVNSEFIQKIVEVSGVNVFACYQCGRCSASCPLVEEMDILPNQMVRLVQLGNEEVLNTATPWICATCFSCTARCPLGIDIAKLAEALRSISLRKNIDKVKINQISFDELMKLPQIALVSNFRKNTSVS